MADAKMDPNAPMQQQPPYPPQAQAQYSQAQYSQAPPQYMSSASSTNVPVYNAQPGYPGYNNGPVIQQQVAPGTVVITTVSSGMRFGTSPVQIICPFCKAQVITSTHYEAGGLVWLVCLFLCLFFICCFFVAFLIDDLKDVVHTCPNCRNVVGRYNRM